MDRLIACPNCYRGQAWNGELADVACRQCGRQIPVQTMASALVHLFSTAVFDPPHDELADEDGDAILQWVVGRVWGDAMRVGRHDWVYAGCPATIDDFCTGIQSLDGSAFDSLGRLLSAGSPPEVLVRSAQRIASAVVDRLNLSMSVRDSEGAILPARAALRERLYDILARFPSVSAVPILERLQLENATMDGDAERPIGAALADALERCRASVAAGVAALAVGAS